MYEQGYLTVTVMRTIGAEISYQKHVFFRKVVISR